MSELTIQEMFDRAVRGLASQGWEPCVSDGSNRQESVCLYSDGTGKHCAWGWVDPSLERSQKGTVAQLRHRRVGIAATLNHAQGGFARQLQTCHDENSEPEQMRNSLRRLAASFDLTWPEDVHHG
jgi:hypothetical protein